jgi:hypothetical protein
MPSSITEANRIHLVLFGMQNRTCGPYLAANNRILISAMHGLRRGRVQDSWPPGMGGVASRAIVDLSTAATTARRVASRDTHVVGVGDPSGRQVGSACPIVHAK